MPRCLLSLDIDVYGVEMSQHDPWVPEIMYEEDTDGVAGNFPFIQVPPDEEMPRFLLIWEYSDSGEFEPGPNGEEVPIIEADMRQYALMDTLKQNLSDDDYDKVRIALGLEPMKIATVKGRAITERIKENLTKAENPRGKIES
jgi:hypothetical protein